MPIPLRILDDSVKEEKAYLAEAMELETGPSLAPTCEAFIGKNCSFTISPRWLRTVCSWDS